MCYLYASASDRPVEDGCGRRSGTIAVRLESTQTIRIGTVGAQAVADDIGFRGFFKELLSATILEGSKEALKTPAKLVGSAAAGAVVSAAAAYLTTPAVAWWAVPVAFVAVTAPTLAYMGAKRRSRTVHAFRVVELSISHTYHDLVHVTHSRRLTLRALRPGLSEWEDRYHWTGNGRLELKSAVPEQSVRKTFRQRLWQYYEVRFDKTLAVNETITINPVWELYDDARTAEPFISTTIQNPTDRLILRMEVVPELSARSVIREIFERADSRDPLTAVRHEFDATESHTWVVDEPQVQRHYVLRCAVPSSSAQQIKATAQAPVNHALPPTSG